MTRRTPAQYDFDKCEFDERILPASPRRATKPRTATIEFIGIHHMTIVGDGSGKAIQGCINTWKTREASAHYGVEETLVAQFVWDRDSAWALADNPANQRSINIEHANSKGKPSWEISAQTLATSARLVANLHVLYKLGRPVAHKTIRWHQEFYATACPGPYFTSSNVWDAYVADCQRIYDEITGTTPAPPVVVPPIIIDPNDPANYYVGAKGDYITDYGKRVVIWSAALGLPAPYKIGPGPSFTATDQAATQKIQVALGYGSSAKDLAKGGNSDGLPGPSTLAKLFSTPPAKPAPKPHIKIMTWNLKSPTLLGKWLTWPFRRGGQVKIIKAAKPTVFLAQEVGPPSKERWYNGALAPALTNVRAHNHAGSGMWRAIWYDPKVFSRVTADLYTMPSMLAKDDKQMAECILKDRRGEPYYFGSLHLENEDATGRTQVKQIEDCFDHAIKMRDVNGVKPEHMFLAGDTNSRDLVREWVEEHTDYCDSAGRAKSVKDKTIASINRWLPFRKGAREDLIFVHKSVSVESFDQVDGHKVSDHNPQIAVITL